MVRFSDNVKSYNGPLTESQRLTQVLQKVMLEKLEHSNQALQYDQMLARLTSSIARLQRQGK